MLYSATLVGLAALLCASAAVIPSTNKNDGNNGLIRVCEIFGGDAHCHCEPASSLGGREPINGGANTRPIGGKFPHPPGVPITPGSGGVVNQPPRTAAKRFLPHPIGIPISPASGGVILKQRPPPHNNVVPRADIYNKFTGSRIPHPAGVPIAPGSGRVVFPGNK